MSSQAPKSSKATKFTNQSHSGSKSSSLSNHLAMVELKQRIITSLTKLADRDTHQIALEDLQSITQSLSPESLPVLLNSLYDTLSDHSNSKPSVKKESLNLLSRLCQSHRDSTLPHLTKIIAHIVKRLKDSDSSVRDACGDAIGVLSGLYLKGVGGGAGDGGGDGNGVGSMVGLFVRPLFEAMGEQNKGVQSGAAMCMAKMVECAAMEGDGGACNTLVGSFQKMCPRICKLLSGQNFQAKAGLLVVVVRLSQVGAIVPQGLEQLLQIIHDCLGSTDWATRKAAADALSALALHSCSLIADGAASSTLTTLEAHRFDKIKPVRDSMSEALQLWKKISGKGDGISDDQKASAQDADDPEQVTTPDKNPNPSNGKPESLGKDSSHGSSLTMDSLAKANSGNIPDKAVVILKKKAPALTDKKLNPEFFQRLQTKGYGDLPVEVVVPQRCLNSSNSNNEEGSEPNVSESRGRSHRWGNNLSDDLHETFNNRWRNIDIATAGKDLRTSAFDGDRIDVNHRESTNRAGFPKSDGQSDGSFTNNKGNLLSIQRQLLQLERQQVHLMNMLQDFMGGSHSSLVTLENRVRGLERIVEDMAHDLSISSGRKGNFGTGFEGSSNGTLGKYNGFSDYSSAKYNGRVPFGERFGQSDVPLSTRGRGPLWRSDVSDARDLPTYVNSKSGQVGMRRPPAGGSMDSRASKTEHESEQLGSRRAWDKGAGPLRLGEGPSARSVWQASKDEATLEAIRVAGEDSVLSRAARVGIPELTAEALGNDNFGQERNPIRTLWSNAMDALKLGDVDAAYAEVVPTGDDLLLVKLMNRSGPVVDQLSNETAVEVLQAIVQFLLEQNLFDICLSWIQQLVELLLENGPEALGIPMELKKDLLLNLYEASTTMDPLEDWEGAAPDQILLQLASAWGIELQHFE